MGDPDEMTRMAAVLAADFSDLQAAASNPECLEITAAGVEKSEVLKTLCAKLGIAPEEAAAFGDGGSDLSKPSCTPQVSAQPWEMPRRVSKKKRRW